MLENKRSVLVVPFSGGSTRNLGEQIAHLEYDLAAAGFMVGSQDWRRLLPSPVGTPDYDAILLIGIGAQKEGLPTLAQLRNLHPKVPIVVMSEWNESEIAPDINLVPDAVFLHRPIKTVFVIERLQECIAAHKKTAE